MGRHGRELPLPWTRRPTAHLETRHLRAVRRLRRDLLRRSIHPLSVLSFARDARSGRELSGVVQRLRRSADGAPGDGVCRIGRRMLTIAEEDLGMAVCERGAAPRSEREGRLPTAARSDGCESAQPPPESAECSDAILSATWAQRRKPSLSTCMPPEDSDSFRLPRWLRGRRGDGVRKFGQSLAEFELADVLDRRLGDVPLRIFGQ